MPNPTMQENIAERSIVEGFRDAYSYFRRIKKLQSLEDDMGADGILEDMDGKEHYVEARRKGFPNHRGKTCVHHNGWKSYFLHDGIYINESTLRKYLDMKIGFYYLVVIFNNRTKSEDRKFARITLDNIKEYLKRKPKKVKSTNSGNYQLVQPIPLKKFNTY